MTEPQARPLKRTCGLCMTEPLVTDQERTNCLCQPCQDACRKADGIKDAPQSSIIPDIPDAESLKIDWASVDLKSVMEPTGDAPDIGKLAQQVAVQTYALVGKQVYLSSGGLSHLSTIISSRLDIQGPCHWCGASTINLKSNQEIPCAACRRTPSSLVDCCQDLEEEDHEQAN